MFVNLSKVNKINGGAAVSVCIDKINHWLASFVLGARAPARAPLPPREGVPLLAVSIL